MRTEPGMIDLGLYRFDPESGPGRGGGGAARYGRLGQWWGWLRRVPPRRWWQAALVVLLTAPLAGAATLTEPPLARLWTVPGSGAAGNRMAVGAEDLYLAEPTEQGWVLTAYRLADGSLRWRTPLDHGGGWVGVRLAGGVPFVITPRQVGMEASTAFDPATGEARWSHQGWPSTMVAGGRLLLVRGLPTEELGGGAVRPYELVAVDPVTGQGAWTVPVSAGEQLLFGQAASGAGQLPARLLTLSQRGRLASYDLATGETISVVEVEPPAGAFRSITLADGTVPGELVARLRSLVSTPGWAQPQVVDDLVILPGPDTGIVAYDADTLALRWRLPDRAWAVPCGPVVCVPAAGWQGLAGVDWHTGSVRWSRECDELPADGRCYLLPAALGADMPVLVEQIVLAGDSVAPVRPLTAARVDPATGAQVAEVGRWRLVGPAGSSGWLLGQRDRRAERTGWFRQFWLARLPADTLRLEVLGSVEADWCDPYGAYLLCRGGERDDAEVWRVR